MEFRAWSKEKRARVTDVTTTYWRDLSTSCTTTGSCGEDDFGTKEAWKRSQLSRRWLFRDLPSSEKCIASPFSSIGERNIEGIYTSSQPLGVRFCLSCDRVTSQRRTGGLRCSKTHRSGFVFSLSFSHLARLSSCLMRVSCFALFVFDQARTHG